MVGTYYPNACLVCDATTSLKRCSRCQMIAYCNVHHQKLHWPEHKELCGVIFDMMREQGVSHLFEKLQGVDQHTWGIKRIMIMEEVGSRLDKQFESLDAQLFKFPRSCFVCHESRQNLLTSCSGCPAASFCQEHPSSPIHDEDCAKIRESFESNITFDKTDVTGFKVAVCSFLLAAKPQKTSDEISSMNKFIFEIASQDCRFAPICREMKIYLSDLFSISMTVFGAFQRLEFSPASKLTIHVKTPVETEQIWEILLHLLPNIKVLKIVYIYLSLDVEEEDGETMLCPICTAKGRRLKIEFVEFSVYMRGKCDKPDFMICTDRFFPGNAGCSMLDAKKLLKLWPRLNCPIIITMFGQGDYRIMKSHIKSCSGNSEVFFEGPNPFRSLLCHRSYQDGRIAWNNNYMIILKSGFPLEFVDRQLSHLQISKTFVKNPDVFYASVCHVCGSSKDLVACKRCRMIFYCGKEHRDEHQPQHKDLCKVILGILNENMSSNLFDKVKMKDSDLWLRAKLELMSKARSKLGREFLNFEKQMFLFPKTCFVCHESDLSVLKNCECGVALCKIHRNDQEHKNHCQNLSLVFKLTISERQEVPKTYVRKLNREGNKAVPISMETCIDSFLNFEKKLSNSDIPNLEKILISDFLTRPFTLLWTLEKLNYKRKSSLVVHVIGSTNSEVTAKNYWKMVLYRFQQLKTLTVVFIGPEISKPPLIENGPEFPSLAGKILHVEAHGLKYEEYFQNKRFIQPNVIVGFNLHLHESKFRNVGYNWKEMVSILRKIKVPFILTAGSETRIRKDHETLCQLLGKKIDFLCCEKNPFAGLIPERDFQTEKILFSNQYFTIYNKLFE